MKIFFLPRLYSAAPILYRDDYSAAPAHGGNITGVIHPGKLFTQVHKKTLCWVEGFSVFNKDVG
jgi:hypothetical protein